MAVIDYRYVRDGHYAKLYKPARILIPVLATLANRETGAIPPETSTARELGRLAGLSERTVREALLALKTAKIIALKSGSGRIPSIQYRPPLQIPKKVNPTALSGQKDRFQPELQTAPPPAPHTSPQERQEPCSSNYSFKEETTTPLPVPKSLIKLMIKEHGPDVVVRIIKGMEEIGGIENPGAYFRRCCEKGWIPTSKKARARMETTASDLRTKAAQEKRLKENDENFVLVMKQHDDPAIQAKIAKCQQDFWDAYDRIPDPEPRSKRVASPRGRSDPRTGSEAPRKEKQVRGGATAPVGG